MGVDIASMQLSLCGFTSLLPVPPLTRPKRNTSPLTPNGSVINPRMVLSDSSKPAASKSILKRSGDGGDEAAETSSELRTSSTGSVITSSASSIVSGGLNSNERSPEWGIRIHQPQQSQLTKKDSFTAKARSILEAALANPPKYVCKSLLTASLLLALKSC